MSAFRDALELEGRPELVICPRCAEIGPTPDRPASLITREPDGSYSCATNFRTPKRERHAE